MLIEPVHQQGWRAELALRFARRDAATLLTERRHSGPLRVQKALYPEGESVCHAIVLHPPSGIVGGDELVIQVTLEAQAHALLTTPGAGKWYRSAGPWASQHCQFEVAADACLEWLPQETIFFSGCNAAISNEIRLAAGARYLGWDAWCLGRSASGERFTQGAVHNRSEIYLDHALLWHEQGQLSGGSSFMDSPAGLAGRNVCVTLYAAGADVDPALLAACRAIAPQESTALVGVTCLPKLLVARYLGDVAEAARNWLFDLWCLLRPVFAGRAAVSPRIWST
jgi:urease accessory protein